MKKIRNIIFIMTFMLLIVGCSKKETTAKETTNNNTTTKKQTRKKDTSTNKVDVYYDVAFLNWDNALITSTTIKEGDIPVYSLTNPAREKDDNYYYVFSGWAPEIGEVHSNTNYVAQFDRFDLPYTINFDLDGGISTDTIKIIKTDELSTDLFSFNISKKGYSFLGWSFDNTIVFDKDGNKINDVTMEESMTFKAIYDELYHSIKFVDYDETELYATTIQDGEIAAYPKSNPTRSNDEDYSYTFSGWNPQLDEVYSDTIYVAQYNRTDLPYTISFDLDGGTSTDTITTIKTDALSKDLFSFNIRKKNYAFAGWSYNNVLVFDSKGNKVNDVTMSSTMTFKAEYREAVVLTINYTLYNPKTNDVIESYETNPEIFGDISETREYAWNTNVNLFADLNEGYSFVGWYSEGIVLSNQTNYNYMMWEEDFTIEARIEYTTYNLSIYANKTDLGQVMIKEGNSQTWYNSQTKEEYYTEEVTIAAYTKTDTRFLGWYDENNKLISSNAIYKFNMVNKDYVLEAKWNSFNVSYELNGGTNNNDNITSYNIDMENFTLLAPTKEGYTFAGWYYNDELITKIDTSNACDMTIVASWALYTVTTITNNNDAGTYTSYTNKGVTEGETISLTASTNTGYTFAGWYLGDEQVSPIEDYSFEMPNHSITLEARWTTNNYILTLTVNSEEGAVEGSGTYNYGEEVTINATAKQGYVFVGWYNEESEVSSSSTYTFKMPYNELILEAKFGYASYTVTLNRNNTSAGTVSGAGSKLYKESVTITAQTIGGYIFSGWYFEGQNVSTNLSYTFQMPSKDVEYEARWTYVTLTTKKNLDKAGSISNYKDEVVYPGTSVTISATTYLCYSFLGWYKDNQIVSSDLSYTFEMPNENVSYEAKFEISDEYSEFDNIFIFQSTRTTITITGIKNNGISNIIVPNYVTSISESAFSGCSFIKSITIQSNISSISSGLFNGCSSLESITLPFVGDKKHSPTDTKQYPFGYIFGTSSYDGGVETKQYFYGSSTSSTTSQTYYIPSTLKEVIITGSSYILRGAFYNCSSLTSITIPDSVVSIEALAFYNCSSLTSVTIPSSVTSIGAGAFYSCSSLISITLPFVGDKKHSPTDTYQYPFGYIFGINKYEGGIGINQCFYSSSTTSTASQTYYIPTTLKEVIITGSSYILCGAFYNCNTLTSITLPNSIRSIESSAFYCCSSLTSITIPNSVTSIGTGAFYFCGNLQSIIVDADNQIYDSRNDCNAIIKTNANKLILGCNNTFIPNSVTSIGENAFTGCIGEILWGDNPSITEIVTYAFSRYKGTNITIPNSVTSIGVYAFDNCSNLATITIPNSVTSIGSFAFYNCSSLTSITLPNSIRSIESGAFHGCSSLISITLPFVGDQRHTPTNTNQYPFGYIFGTSSYDGGVETIQYFYGSSTSSTTNKTYYIPETLKEVIITGSSYILYGAFYNCSRLTNITIPNSITSIESFAFYNCNRLANITIPNRVTSIGDSAFSGCSRLTSITLLNSATSIGSSTFENCTSLTSIYYIGTSTQWSSISIEDNNTSLTNSTLYYYSETQPTESGNYWHYGDSGEIIIWN